MDIDETNDFSLTNAIDVAIVMHRETHFGGRFDFMLDYYAKEGKGANPDFEIARIRELQAMEEGLKQDLAAMLLSGAEAERVAEAKAAYKKLRDLYETKRSKISKANYPLLIADLILSEEEEPEKEIAAIVAEKGLIVPSLIHLLRAEDYYDSLFPGYGLAPTLAAKCLGLIGDKRAIISLFELIGEEDFFSEDVVLSALKQIGEPAKEFLLRVLHSKPITFDNERAAIALDQFKDDPEVSIACFKALKELDLKQHEVLATYLILACEGLGNTPYKEEFLALANSPNTPKTLKQDLLAIANHWKEKR